MSRFYVSSSQVFESERRIYLTGGDVNHLKNVLRARTGDKCEIISDDGRRFGCAVICFSDEKAELSIENTDCGMYEPVVRVRLLQGIPKGEKSELIIQKSVELGVSEIAPVMSERSVVRFQNLQDREKKALRWNKISEEASKQCGRNFIPKVEVPKSLRDIDFNDSSVKIMPYENETERTLKSVLNDENIRKRCIEDGITVFIGPEGGISPEEYSMLSDIGFIPVTLGKRILRTETAPICFLSDIRYEFED